MSRALFTGARLITARALVAEMELSLSCTYVEKPALLRGKHMPSIIWHMGRICLLGMCGWPWVLALGTACVCGSQIYVDVEPTHCLSAKDINNTHSMHRRHPGYILDGVRVQWLKESPLFMQHLSENNGGDAGNLGLPDSPRTRSWWCLGNLGGQGNALKWDKRG